MKHTEAGNEGSFVAWGHGFRYNYEGPSNTLSIAHLERQKVFTKLRFDQSLLRNPLGYVEALDKTNQIKALMYSNNMTTNLADTMEIERIAPIIENTAKISRYAFDLQIVEYDHFAQLFCGDFELKALKIKKFIPTTSDNSFYIARMQTRYNNSIAVRRCTLPGLIAALSEHTLRDLITMEFGHRYQNSAQNLLNASARLATLSRVLDEHFIPECHLRNTKAPESFEEQSVKG
jgi:hypothetical protein